MTVKKPLASLLLIGWTTLAHADDFGTKALEANETRQAGKLVACSLDFRQTLMDFVPVPSRPVTVKGSFSIVAPNDPKKPAWVIQVAPQEAIIQAGKLFYQAFTPLDFPHFRRD